MDLAKLQADSRARYKDRRRLAHQANGLRWANDYWERYVPEIKVKSPPKKRGRPCKPKPVLPEGSPAPVQKARGRSSQPKVLTISDVVFFHIEKTPIPVFHKKNKPKPAIDFSKLAIAAAAISEKEKEVEVKQQPRPPTSYNRLPSPYGIADELHQNSSAT